MKLATLTILLLLAIGCTPYPRYGQGGSTTPKNPLGTVTGSETDDFFAAALIIQSYLGRPYATGDKSNEGIDCSQFTRDVYRRARWGELPRTVAEQYQTGMEAPRNRLMFGDLVFFKTEWNEVSHVGIYIGHTQFIHASRSLGVVISDLREDYYAKRYVGARRLLP